MRKTILFFIVLALAVWAGIHIQKDPGYIMIAIYNWSIEMPLWFGAIMLLFISILVSYLLKLIKSISSVGNKYNSWKDERKNKKSHKLTQLGLIQFTEGNWNQAENLLIKAISSNSSPLINYLASAKAAQEQGNFRARDQHLRDAQIKVPDAKIAIELTQAQLQIANEQWEQALATLQHLLSLTPHHHYVIKLLSRVYYILKDWGNLVELLPILKNKNIFNADELKIFEDKAYIGILTLAKDEPGKLIKLWNGFAKNIKNNHDLANYVAKLLINIQSYENAYDILKRILKKDFNDESIHLYSLCHITNKEKQLQFAEGLLNSHANNPNLLLALGRICKNNQLWGKARTYLENSAQVYPSISSYMELANLLDEINESNLANQYYKNGLLLAQYQEHSLNNTNKDLIYLPLNKILEV